MVKTVTQGFVELRKNLEITGLQSTTVSGRQQLVRNAIAAEMNVLDSFLTGSYMRSTMIAPLKDADVDVFIVLDPKYFSASGQASLLDKVKRALKKTYDTPDISRAGRAVTISFSDFKVDVVPGFNRQGGGYLIPDSAAGAWIGTNPKRHVELWSQHNKNHGGMLVPIIKMLKAWNKLHSAILGSFHLETLAVHVFTGIQITSDPQGLRYFFNFGQSPVSFPLPDPAGYSGTVGRLSTSEISDVKSRMNTAYQRAVEATQLAAEDKIKAAIDKLRLIFGDYFPSYG